MSVPTTCRPFIMCCAESSVSDKPDKDDKHSEGSEVSQSEDDELERLEKNPRALANAFAQEVRV